MKLRSLPRWNPETLDARIKRSRGIKLEVWEADRFGNRLSKGICKDNDLFTDQAGGMIAALMMSPTRGSGEPPTVSIGKDTGNTARSAKIYTTSNWMTYYNNYGIRVGVGTGVGAAARTDYTLGTQVGSWTAPGANGVYSSVSGAITLAGNVVIVAGATVTEAALTCDVRDNGGTMRQMMICRDVYEGVVIGAGNSAHCAYTIQL